MSYKTFLIKETLGGLIIIFNRLAEKNSINADMLNELNQLLDEAENEPQCRMLILKGQQGLFCTGMDFLEVALHDGSDRSSEYGLQCECFMETLRRFTLTSKIIISIVDGKAIAGGVGLVAASDWVISSEQSHFSLSEALWGLMPAIVIPYLIRRVGFQQAYRMALTTIPVCARKAYNIGLVDEIGAHPDNMIRKLYARTACIEESTIKNIKQYFRKMWFLSNHMEAEAASELNRLLGQATFLKNIRNYIEKRCLPWE